MKTEKIATVKERLEKLVSANGIFNIRMGHIINSVEYQANEEYFERIFARFKGIEKSISGFKKDIAILESISRIDTYLAANLFEIECKIIDSQINCALDIIHSTALALSSETFHPILELEMQH